MKVVHKSTKGATSASKARRNSKRKQTTTTTAAAKRKKFVKPPLSKILKTRISPEVERVLKKLLKRMFLDNNIGDKNGLPKSVDQPSENPPMMNWKRPAAQRKFFGKEFPKDERSSDAKVVCSVYGTGWKNKSMAIGVQHQKTHALTDELKMLIEQVKDIIKKEQSLAQRT